MPGATVTLSQSYAGAGGGFGSLSFRQPRWADFVELGNIEEWQPVGAADPDTGQPRMMLVRHHDVVAAYAERLVAEPRNAGDLALLDLPDVLAVHEAIRDFFLSARSSKEKPTGSSGDTEKASAKSGD